ncbi:hypothetical protein D1872_334950 [compost metagenome]
MRVESGRSSFSHSSGTSSGAPKKEKRQSPSSSMRDGEGSPARASASLRQLNKGVWAGRRFTDVIAWVCQS